MPVAIVASEAPARAKSTNYPELFASRMAGRRKHPLGDLFGLRNFGVNLTRLEPGAATALHHRHSLQDEFVYVLAGEPTLVGDDGVVTLRPGMCAGFRSGGPAHHLENRGTEEVIILEVGDRSVGDEVVYPHDDIAAVMGEDGRWSYRRKNGEAY